MLVNKKVRQEKGAVMVPFSFLVLYETIFHSFETIVHPIQDETE